MPQNQDIAEAVLDAEVRIGKLLKEVPKATPNNNPYHESSTNETLVNTPKEELRKEAGISKAQAFRFQVMAERHDVVEEAKAKSH